MGIQSSHTGPVQREEWDWVSTPYSRRPTAVQSLYSGAMSGTGFGMVGEELSLGRDIDAADTELNQPQSDQPG